MRLFVIGSGSSGNCYLLENETECLVIEAGIPYKEVKKAIDFQTRKIVGVIAGHAHLDHSKYISEYEKAGIPVYKPYDGMETMSMPNSEFIIRAFDLVHDVPCFGFHICHPEIGNLLYASDTEYIKYKFKGLNNILIEANYSMDFVDKDKPNYEHVLQGHMSIDTTCKFLEVNKNPMLRNVILCHLSNENADREDFINQAEKVVNCPVYVARKGLEISLDLIPDWMK